MRRLPARQHADAQRLVSEFESSLRALALPVHDTAAAKALAFAMAFHAYHNEAPGPARLQRLHRDYREALANDQVFQGTADAQRQDEYESLAASAALAMAARIMSVGRSGAEREQLLRTARSGAAELAKRLWTLPIEGVELSPGYFGDRGARLAAAGIGSTSFRAGQATGVVENYAQMWSLRYSRSYVAQLPRRFAAEIERRGGSATDLADSYATGLVLLWRVTTGGRVEPNQAQWGRVRDILAKDFRSQPAWQRASDEEREKSHLRLAIVSMEKLDSFERALRESRAPVSNDPLARIAGGMGGNLLQSISQAAAGLLRENYRPDFLSEAQQVLGQ
jgi:hypothetical protein